MTLPAAPLIVVLDVLAERSRQRFSELVPPTYRLEVARERSVDHWLSLIAGATHAITGQVAVPAELLEAAPQLRMVHKWGVGVDNIDLAAAARLGIAVARLEGGNARPVAEYTLGLMLATLRHIAWSHRTLREGIWTGSALRHDSLMLNGRTVGIVGCGAIGREVSRLVRAFGCRVLYTQRKRLPAEVEQSLEARYCALPDLLSEADIVSLHCPLTEETRGLINARTLAMMKRDAVLINVARGGVVNEADLCVALLQGTILAAACDVFETEPLPADSPLRRLDNLVLSPHIAAIAADNLAPTVKRMLDNIARLDRGEPLPPGDLVVARGLRPGAPA